MRYSLILLSFVLYALNVNAQSGKKLAVSSMPPLVASFAAGQALYKAHCLTCHMDDGGGVPNMNPSLVKSSYALGEKSKIINVLLNGLSHVEIDGDNYQNVMPSHSFLTDRQIADVLTYVRNSWGNKASRITDKDVKELRPGGKG